MTRLRIAFVALLALIAAFSTAPARAQSPGETAILAAMDTWSATYGSATSSAQMVALYHPDAVFWGTGARAPFVGAPSFAPYFDTQFTNYPTRRVAFVDPVIRLFADDTVATATGLYRFNVATAAGQQVEALYRFSFSFLLTPDGWKIIHQHSSALPPG
jgi:hypothetical protein